MVTPAAKAALMALSFFTVLPKEMRSGAAPAARHASISSQDAASKEEPRPARRSRIGAAGFAFTA